MYLQKSSSEASLLRKREGTMWVDMKGPPWGQEGTSGRGASGKQLGGCVLVILLRSGDAVEAAELREGDAQGGPVALHLHLDHQVSAVPQR